MRAPTDRRAASRLLLPLAAAACVLAAGCQDTCPFKLIAQRNLAGSLPPGAFAIHQIVLPAEDGLEVDASNASAGAERVDLWLTAAGCERLFDEPYPLPSGGLPPPRCAVILGPVAMRTVSARAKVSPGDYRLFVYAWASNSNAVAYLADVGMWGHTCRPGSLGPPG